MVEMSWFGNNCTCNFVCPSNVVNEIYRDKYMNLNEW